MLLARGLWGPLQAWHPVMCQILTSSGLTSTSILCTESVLRLEASVLAPPRKHTTGWGLPDRHLFLSGGWESKVRAAADSVPDERVHGLAPLPSYMGTNSVTGPTPPASHNLLPPPNTGVGRCGGTPCLTVQRRIFTNHTSCSVLLHPQSLFHAPSH